MTFGYTTIRENNVRLNNDLEKCRSALWSCDNSTIRSNYVWWYFFSATQPFGKITFRQNNDSLKWCFGKMMWPRQKWLFFWSKLWKLVITSMTAKIKITLMSRKISLVLWEFFPACRSRHLPENPHSFYKTFGNFYWNLLFIWGSSLRDTLEIAF